MSEFGRALASRSRAMASIFVGSSTGVAEGPRCQLSATARTPPDASNTRPVTPADWVDASQVTIGATQRSRRDRVGGHAVAAQLEGGDDREAGDAHLGGAVVRLARVAVDARHRARVDEACVVRLPGLG